MACPARAHLSQNRSHHPGEWHYLVECGALGGTIEIAGFLVRARRKPQRYPRYREDLQRCHGRKDAVSSAE